jgi:hypothetical protein
MNSNAHAYAPNTKKESKLEVDITQLTILDSSLRVLVGELAGRTQKSVFSGS